LAARTSANAELRPPTRAVVPGGALAVGVDQRRPAVRAGRHDPADAGHPLQLPRERLQRFPVELGAVVGAHEHRGRAQRAGREAGLQVLDAASGLGAAR
jgi:hypothetical protein